MLRKCDAPCDMYYEQTNKHTILKEGAWSFNHVIIQFIVYIRT